MGTVFPQGSEENSVLGCMPDPYSVTFSTNKRDSPLLYYYNIDRIFKLFVSEEL